jgi:Ca-activated chloride channel family protein
MNLFKTSIPGLLVLLLAGAAAAKLPDQEVKCRVETERAVLPAGEAQTTIIKITLDAPPPPSTKDRPAVNLCVVLDRSGSMSGSKIQKAREAAVEAVRRLGPRDVFSLVTYDNEVRTLIPAQHAGNTAALVESIQGIRSGGGTALFGGVSQGAAEIRKSMDGEYVHRLILLSDGLANVGPSSPADLGRLGAALSKEQLSVTTIGVGNDYNEDLMVQLAQNSDGNHYFVEISHDLPRIFASELGDVLSVVAQKVILEIECPGGVTPKRIIGRDGRIQGNRVEVNLNQLYGGQEKYALLEVEIPAGIAHDQIQIAEARLRYDNLLTQQPATSVSSTQVRFSQVEREVKESGNRQVQEEVVFQKAAEARQEAVQLYDAGRKDEAVQRLGEVSADLKNYVTDNALPQAPAAAAAGLEQEADQVDADGYDKTSRKKAKFDIFRSRSQQKGYKQ